MRPQRGAKAALKPPAGGLRPQPVPKGGRQERHSYRPQREGMDDNPLDRIPDRPVRAAAHAFREIVGLTVASRPLRERHASGGIVLRDGGRSHGRRKVFARDGPVNDGGPGLVR